MDNVLNQQPYKQLAYYEPQDAALFFGRDQEIKTLTGLIRQNRLVLLYGPSGVGKTSLLLAGAAATLQAMEPDNQLIYVRVSEDPALAIRRMVTRQLDLPGSDGTATPADMRAGDLFRSLRQSMMSGFGDSELMDLCLDLGVDYSTLSGSNRADKVRELIVHCRHHGRLPELVAYLTKERPRLPWPSISLLSDLAQGTAVVPPQTPSGMVDLFSQAAKQLNQTFLIFLDQFERFFTQIAPSDRQVFIEELSALYHATDVPVRIVLSTQEDTLAKLMDEVERVIPELFRAKMSLSYLSRAGARAAITQPLASLGLVCEPALVDRLLTDLTLQERQQAGAEAERIMPPQLQLVCHALFGQLPHGRQQMTMADYEAIGGMEGILGRYLDQELQPFAAPDRRLVRAVLEALVSSTNTRQVVTMAELTTSVGADPEKLEALVEKLVQRQLVRPLELEHTTGYELVHDYLARQIELSQEVRDRKAVEELIQQEVRNWRMLRTLISPERLQLIQEKYAQTELSLSPEMQDLLAKSRAKKELDELEQLQIIESDKMHFLEQIVTGIDKEISSPIAAINSNSSLLRTYVADINAALGPATAVDDVPLLLDEIVIIAGEMETAVKKVTRLMKVLSNLAQSDEAGFRPVNLTETIEAALLLLEVRLLRNHIRIQKQLPATAIVRGLSSQLLQLFVSIIDSSVEAMATAEPPLQKATLRLTTFAQEDYIVTVVVHNGRAFNPETFDELFNPRQPAAASEGQRSLNLSIAKQIVHRHQGNIEIPPVSDPGKTGLKISLPLFHTDVPESPS